jgi:energy-coupling factor transporter ATP-binding protein EcfA2
MQLHSIHIFDGRDLDVVLEPLPITVLFGPNDAGKTNLLTALDELLTGDANGPSAGFEFGIDVSHPGESDFFRRCLRDVVESFDARFTHAVGERAAAREPVGFANSGGLVFVDESAEQVAAVYAGRCVERCWVAAVGREQVERAVWPVLVVMAAVDAEDVLEVASAENQDSVEAVSADRAHPAFGVGVRVRGLNGRPDHPDALGAKDLVEGVAELRSWTRNRNGC